VLEGAGLSTSQSFYLADPLPVREHATSTTNATFTTVYLLITYPPHLYEKESVLEGAGLSTSQSCILSEADPLRLKEHAYCYEC